MTVMKFKADNQGTVYCNINYRQKNIGAFEMSAKQFIEVCAFLISMSPYDEREKMKKRLHDALQKEGGPPTWKELVYSNF